ncbi:transglutaminase domain-containing protein [Candidatus Dojkabacteria bacterium]|uniref:Transglutaminase domain-containing protein n=1 Tax=Candidatus Dojkabacteria bacterium TaxID=2099670 RepID=A0A955I9U3_9BACT|nr:transglutaminase domain-containing protein [Candidatus Dojkabacteria bacterium]
MTKLLKLLIFVNILIFSSILLNGNAKALSYDLKMEFEVNLMENNSAGVTQKVVLRNNSADFLSTSMSLDFPFAQVDSLKVVSEGTPLPATIENARLWIEFEDQALEFGETKQIDISYQVVNFVNVYGDIRGISWPKFNVEEEEIKYPLKIVYPVSWDDVYYSSEGVDMNVVFDTKRAIAFTDVTKPVGVYFGNFTLKQFNIQLDKTRLLEGETSLRLPLNNDFYISGVNESTNINRAEEVSTATIDVEKYILENPLGIISTQERKFDENISLSPYSRGIEKIDGIESNDPTKLYKVLLAKLRPQTEITQWSRKSISEILEQDKHSDIDYATVYSEVLKSKKIPTRILYGIVLFPDGNYHWHFWLTYLDKTEEESQWKQIDPFMEAVTGYEGYSNVTPVRIIWGQLNDSSDLSDINLDLFTITPEKFQLRNFTNPSAQSGYITSQLNDKPLTGEVSVLGASTNNLKVSNSLQYSILYIMAGTGLLIISAIIYKREFHFNLNRKSRN